MKKLILIIILMMLFISGCNVSEKKYEEFKKITIEESGYTFVSSACYSDNHSYYLFKEIIEKELKSINKNYKLVDNQMINQDGVNDRIYFQIDYKYSKKNDETIRAIIYISIPDLKFNIVFDKTTSYRSLYFSKTSQLIIVNEEKLSFYNDEFEKKLEVENKSYSKIVLEDDFIFISSADLIYSDDKIVHDLIINKQFEIVYENTTTTTNYMYKRNKEYYCPGIIIIRNRNDFSFNDIIGFDLINLKFLSKDEVTERLDKYHEDNKESIIEIDGDILKLHDRTLEMEILKTNNQILKQIYDIYGYLRFDQVIVDNNETYIVMVNDKSFFGMVGMVPRSPRIVFRYNSDNTLTYIGYAHFTNMKVLKILKK